MGNIHVFLGVLYHHRCLSFTVDQPMGKMTKEDRIRVAGWLEVDEWTPTTAAHLLLNLDPECTAHPDGVEDWGCHWVCRDRRNLSLNEFAQTRPADAAARYSRDRNLDMAFDRMLRFTSATDPLRVHTPAQWVAWAKTHNLLPSWLAGASGLENSKVQRPNKIITLRQLGRLGAQAKHANSPAGRAKAEILPRIRTWLSSSPTTTRKAFVEALLAELQNNPSYTPTSKKIPEHETVMRWMREEERSLTS